ncbi:MAG TPA: hypothetical protein VF190_02810 [Rhodothermales bacterium]
MKGSLRALIVGIAIVVASGCSIFGGENDGPRPRTGDVCADRFNQFVSQDEDGLGVTSEQCAESVRGQWIVGEGCYCHGEGDV